MAAGLCACEQRSPERDPAAKIPGYDAAERYAEYVKHHGERTQQLRRAAAKAATMRIRITSLYLKRDECLPLTREEVKAVRGILAELEETPVHDKKLWPDHECDIYFGPQPVAAIYDSFLEFVAADGHVLDSFREFDSVMVDAVQAEAYCGPATTLPICCRVTLYSVGTPCRSSAVHKSAATSCFVRKD